MCQTVVLSWVRQWEEILRMGDLLVLSSAASLSGSPIHHFPDSVFIVPVILCVSVDKQVFSKNKSMKMGGSAPLCKARRELD